MAVKSRWWHTPTARRAIFPRACSLKNGDAGFCFVRENRGGQIVLNTYGRSTGFCVDPVEKKPLNHFYPGTSVLSFGTPGCNLGCKFCQAWEITKSREVLHLLSQRATPEMIAEAAIHLGCRSVAFTYNDPVICAEDAIDSASRAMSGAQDDFCDRWLHQPRAAQGVFGVMDATNVDLKGFTEHFYQHYTLSHLAPVLDTLRWLKHESNVWLEITNLVIPRANDDPGEIRRMCEWILENLGPDVPLHFSAFHPDFRLRERPPTPHASLIAARTVALRAGLNYAYVGNVLDSRRESTYCPNCGRLVIGRAWYDIGRFHVRDGKCGYCGHAIAGHFDAQPGHWGTKRVPVDPAEQLHTLEPSGIKP
jgi:AmmeMemoRadiSam system radical SAM enzyme